MDTPKEQYPAIPDYASQSKQLEKRRLENAAKIEALQREQEEIRQEGEKYRKLEEEQKQMAKEKIFAGQQEFRQQEFRSNIAEHVIRGLRLTADSDRSFANAISCISNDQGIEEDLSRLHTALLSELAGLKADFLLDVAKRIKTQLLHTVDDILTQFEINHPISTSPEVPMQLPVKSDLSDVATPTTPTSVPEAKPPMKHPTKTAVRRSIDSLGSKKRASDASVDSETSNAGCVK